MQWVEGKLAFTLTDTVSRKAVLGLPTRAASLSVGDNIISFGSLSYAATSAQAASVALVLDASGSMQGIVYDSSTGKPLVDANDKYLTGLRLTARAAHAFLDGKRSEDEIGVHIFSSRQAWIDQDYFDNSASLYTVSDNQPYVPNYGASGFHANAADLRLAVDFYNDSSAIWSSSPEDELHADIPFAVRSRAAYPFGGNTALYEAGKQAVVKVAERNNARKIVVLLTDGEATDYDKNGLISAAQADSLPLWTVGLGSSVDEDTLQELADKTGGSFINSADPKALAAEFEAIQTGIVFQYVTEALSGVSPGDVVNLKVSYGNGQVVERDLTVPAN